MGKFKDFLKELIGRKTAKKEFIKDDEGIISKDEKKEVISDEFLKKIRSTPCKRCKDYKCEGKCDE